MSEKSIIKQVTTGLWKENSYQICYKESNWIIDPGGDFECLIECFDCKNIIGILATHGHFDHIGAVADFQSRYSSPFYLHSKDKRVMCQANLHRKIVGDDKVYTTPRINYFLDQILVLPFMDKNIQVHYLPGHTEGSMGFEFEKKLFTGDLFYYNGLKLNDLPGGNQEKLLKSIEFVITNFEGYEIYPGHGKHFVLDKLLINKFKNIIDELRNFSN